MSKEIIVSTGKQTRIAIVEDRELVELFIENQEHERTIGNVFLGRVRRVMPNIQAAFVDIGQKQDAFLHFSDLIENLPDWLQYAKADSPQIGKFKAHYTTRPAKKRRRHPQGQKDSHHRDDGNDDEDESGESRRAKSVDSRRSAQKRQHGSHEGSRKKQEAPPPADFNPAEILTRDQPILVKISKEPIANKGSRVTTDISLAGRFLVLVPMANYVAVSKKIQSFKERKRLRALARSLLPEGFGVIVRTVADGRNAKALDTDLNLLLDKWHKIEAKLKSNPKPPTVLHEDVNMMSSIMRDLFTEDYDRILIDDERLYKNVKGYVQAIAPQLVPAVHQHKGDAPVFRAVGIEAAVDEAFQSRVNLPGGGYLFIEQTEAMHVIDVNSGRAGRGLSQEDNSVKVNVEAAKVMAKQIRLRDLGGIIVVDFIDVRDERNKRKVFDALRREFRKDRAVTKLLPMSDFGIIQITRQRLRPSITHTFSAPAEPALAETNGAGPADKPRRVSMPKSYEPSHLSIHPEDLVRKIDDWLEEYRSSGGRGPVKMVVHPFTASYFQRRIPNQTTRWFLKHLLRLRVETNPQMDPLTFRLYDIKSGKEISKVKEEGSSKRRSGRGRGRSKSEDMKDGGASDQKNANPRQESTSKAESGSASGRDSGRGSRGDARRSGGGSSEKDARRSGGGSSEKNSRRSGGGSSDKDTRRSGGGSSDKDSRRSGGGSSDKDSRRSGGGSSNKDSRRSGGGSTERDTQHPGGGSSEREAGPSGGSSEQDSRQSSDATRQDSRSSTQHRSSPAVRQPGQYYRPPDGESGTDSRPEKASGGQGEVRVEQTSDSREGKDITN